MLKKILAALALVASSVVMTATPATADTPGCVSDGEYKNLEPGERQVSVHNRFDTTGWLVDTYYANGYWYTHRQYVRCPSPQMSNRVNVEFRNPSGPGGYTRAVRWWRSTD